LSSVSSGVILSILGNGKLNALLFFFDFLIRFINFFLTTLHFSLFEQNIFFEYSLIFNEKENW
jgi:hypothetical protein